MEPNYMKLTFGITHKLAENGCLLHPTCLSVIFQKGLTLRSVYDSIYAAEFWLEDGSYDCLINKPDLIDFGMTFVYDSAY